MKIYINGLGVISEAGCSANELSELTADREYTAKGQRIEFKSNIPSSKLRRCSRYTKMAASAADLALADNACEITDPYAIGAVVSSGYGSIEYNIQFSDQVQRHEPQICSPSIFSQTVPNSCLGQICMINGIKGSGTMLRGGDPLEYATLQLQLTNAETMLCGQVEEWSDELISSFENKEAASGCTISEGAAFLTLNTDFSDNTYCEVEKMSSVNITNSPLIKINKNIGKDICDVLSDFSDKKADMIFKAANGTWFDEVENRAIKDAFGEIATAEPKMIFGETLGSAYLLSVSLAATALKNGSYKGRKCSSIIVAGFDMAGNYNAVRLLGVR